MEAAQQELTKAQVFALHAAPADAEKAIEHAQSPIESQTAAAPVVNSYETAVRNPRARSCPFTIYPLGGALSARNTAQSFSDRGVRKARKGATSAP